MEYKNKKTRRPQSEHSWAHLPIQYHTFTKKKKINTQSHISQHFYVFVYVCVLICQRQYSSEIWHLGHGCDLSSAQQHNCTQPDLPSLVSITLSCHFSVSQSVTHSLTSSPFLRYSGAQKLFKKKYYKKLSFSCCSKAVRLTFFCETRFFFFKWNKSHFVRLEKPSYIFKWSSSIQIVFEATAFSICKDC